MKFYKYAAIKFTQEHLEKRTCLEGVVSWMPDNAHAWATLAQPALVNSVSHTFSGRCPSEVEELTTNAKDIPHLLRRAGQCADSIYANALSGTEFSPRQAIVLRALGTLETASQIDLARTTGIDRTTITKIVGRLVERGFVERERTETDTRMYAARLTRKGASAMADIKAIEKRSERELLRAVPRGVCCSFGNDRRAFRPG